MINKTKLTEYIKKQEFNPDMLGLLINPFYFARRGLYKNISELSKFIKGKVLDVGCGQKPYEKLFKCEEYIGLEYDTPQNRQGKKADFFYDGKTFPFKDNEFDGAVLNEVLEHIFNPDEFLSELNRVLKDDANLLLTVPFIWDEHEQPYDFARYSSFGIKHILEKHGFEILEFKKSVDDVGVIFQLINDYIYKLIIKKDRKWEFWVTNILTCPFNLVGLLLSVVLPKNKDLYLDNIVLAKKVRNA
jgi:SAM-dependent methyltransferase